MLKSKGRRFVGACRGFCRDTSGSATVEFVIWMPIYVAILVLVTNVSLIFFQEAKVLRVAQDANRSYSLGRMESVAEAETYIRERLGDLGAGALVSSTVSNGVIQTDVHVPVEELLLLNLPALGVTRAFDGLGIRVRADHVLEF